MTDPGGRSISPCCRVLVGGYGRPGQRDLDLGRPLVSYLQQLEWPDGVVIEDLSYAAPMVLHRLQELQPSKAVLVGAVSRGGARPGTVRQYRVDVNPPQPEEVRQRLEESAQGMVDLDHTLAVARHWGGLPAETVVVEVEPADCSFGIGFSEEMAQVFDPIVAILRAELDGAVTLPADLGRQPKEVAGAVTAPSGSGPLADLADYATRHKQARLFGGGRRGQSPGAGSSAVMGLAVAGRTRPWSVGVGSGSDWCDVIPLDDSWVAIVAGDVPGRGAEAVGTMSEVRAAVRAYAAIDGHSPALVLRHLDRLARAGGLGEAGTLVYLTVHVPTGEVRLSNAGHCPPLLLDDHRRTAVFLRHAASAPLGRTGAMERTTARVRPDPASTLVVFSDGLVTSRGRSLPDGLEALRRAALGGPDGVDALCDHVLTACLTGMRRDDDIALLAVELPLAEPSRDVHGRWHLGVGMSSGPGA